MAALQCEICGGKLIGKPGGIFECDSCGMEYSTEWAKAKIQEIRGTVKVEGTVQVEGTVKVEGAQNIDSLLALGFEELAQAKRLGQPYRDRAKAYFEQARTYDAQNGDALLGVIMCGDAYILFLRKNMAEGVTCNTRDKFWECLLKATPEDRERITSEEKFQKMLRANKSTRLEKEIENYKQKLMNVEKAVAEKKKEENVVNLFVDQIVIALLNQRKTTPLETANLEFESLQRKLYEQKDIQLGYIKLKADIESLNQSIKEAETKKGELEKELSKLGIFSGKRKAEIKTELQRIKDELERLYTLFNENTQKLHGRSEIDIAHDIEMLEKQFLSAQEKLEAEQKRANGSVNIKQALKELENPQILEALRKRHPFAFKLYKLVTCNVGDTVTLGEGGKEIEWRVLEKTPTEILLIQKDCRIYGEYKSHDYYNQNDDATWEGSDIRRRLDGYYKDIFSKDEKQIIKDILVTAERIHSQDKDPGADTIDKLFLLSTEEANKYFKGDEDRKAYYHTYENGEEKIRQCSWWLRNVERYTDKYHKNKCNAAIVSYLTDTIRYEDVTKVAFIRPAIWVEVKSGFEEVNA